jgi:predicted NAD/FAD-dependent oxidoreductase
VWDKGRGEGGRLTTSRLEGGAESLRVDTGAQYFSVKVDAPVSPEFASLLADGVLVPLAPDAVILGEESGRGTKRRHYVAPAGASSLPKHLLKRAGVVPSQSRKVASVSPAAGGGLCITDEEGVVEAFHAAVCTIPAPQVLALEGHELRASLSSDAWPAGGTVGGALGAVTYSSRHVLALGFSAADGGAASAAAYAALPFTLAYVTPNTPGAPDMRYVAVDSRKRSGGDSAHPAAVVVHSRAYTEGVDMDKANPPRLAEQLRELYPALPVPTAVKAHFWRYGQVTARAGGVPVSTPRDDAPAALALSNGLILAGDYFTLSSLEGSFESGRAAAQLVAAQLQRAP